MENEYIITNVKWVSYLYHVMYCAKHNTGHVRGLTSEQYKYLKPIVEKLSVEHCGKAYHYENGVWCPIDGNLKEIIFKIKEWFKELEKHPELLAEHEEDIIFYVDQIWNGTSFMYKEFKRDKNGKRHYTGVEPTWV